MSLTSKLPRSREADNFGIIRLAASIVVVYGHSFPLSGSPSLVLLGNSIEALAVKVFFVVSGYLITQSWIFDPNIFRYFLKRALRIFPALIVVVIATAIVLGPVLTVLSLNNYFQSNLFFQYFSNMYLYPVYSLPGVFLKNIYPMAVNGSLWSLPVEFLMYIIVPIILQMRSKFIIAGITVMLVCASVIMLRVPGAQSGMDIVVFGSSLRSALDVAPFFLIGSGLRSIMSWLRPNIQIAMMMASFAMLVPPNILYQELALYIVLPYMVIAFAFAKPARFAFVERMGDLSYGTYLFSFPLQQIVIQIFNTAHHPFRTILFAPPFSRCLQPYFAPMPLGI